MMAQVCLPACCSAKSRLRRAIGERRSPSVVGWVGGSGDAVNPSMGAWPRHPCRGHPRPAYPPGLGQISAADPPREINNKSKSGSLRSQSRGRQPTAVAVAFASAFSLDLPVVVRRPESVWGRAGGVGGVSAPWMARLSPHGWVHGVPANPTRPAHPQETRFQRPTQTRHGGAPSFADSRRRRAFHAEKKFPETCRFR